MNNPVREIIKYNRTRKYFGTWTPANLHNAYKTNRVSEYDRSVTLETGKISIDDICNTLWNEMSYNPLRFGSVSPFKFSDMNSVVTFCNQENFPELDSTANEVLSKIKHELRMFLNLIKTYDRLFLTNRTTQSSYVKIKMQEYSIRSNDGYKILSHLVACIHLICQQNVKDFDKKSKPYRNAIIKTIFKRHPDLQRKTKNPCFAQVEELERQLLQEITEKNSEITNTTMRINDNSEYDVPLDSSKEQELLKQQQKELQILEIKLNNTRNNFLVLTR